MSYKKRTDYSFNEYFDVKLYPRGLKRYIMLSKETYIQEITWQDARQESGIESEFKKIVDEISPHNDFTLFKVCYPFGQNIFKDSVFYLPNDKGISIPIIDSSIAKNIRTQLGYNILPLGMIIKNGIEVFREIEDKVFCVAFYSNGLDIGIWEHFNWSTPYTVSAGARSLYMLPSISDISSHKRLKKEFGIIAPPPKRLYDHWRVFTELANSPSFPDKWFCEILFLTDKWLEKIKNDVAWIKLDRYLWQKGWQHSGYGRRKAILDIAWDELRSVSSKNIKVDHHAIDVLKHLIFVGTGTVPASAPVIGQDEAGPLRKIQIIYETIYGLESIATIMQPRSLMLSNLRPVYYSLSMQKLLETAYKTRKTATIIDNIRELQELLNHFINYNYRLKFYIAAESLYKIINNLNFDFFHGEMYAYGITIRPSTEMPEQDLDLLYDPYNKGNRVFASSSSFLKRCVRISHKSEKSN